MFIRTEHTYIELERCWQSMAFYERAEGEMNILTV